MSSSSKATTVIIVLVLIGLGIWWYSTSSSAPLTQAAPSADTSALGQAALPAAPDTSDSSLQNDLNAADTGISAVSSDSAQVDSGLNDKPVSQQ